MQLSSTLKRIDHQPLVILHKTHGSIKYTGPDANEIRWDPDQLVDCLMYGRGEMIFCLHQ